MLISIMLISIVIIFILLTAFSIEHYFKPKTALQEWLERTELEKEAHTKLNEFEKPPHPYKIEGWK